MVARLPAAPHAAARIEHALAQDLLWSCASHCTGEMQQRAHRRTAEHQRRRTPARAAAALPDHEAKRILQLRVPRVQREVIEAVLADNDAFVLLPTGGGKSLCYRPCSPPG